MRNCRRRWRHFSKEASENAENILNQVQIENRNRYDYRKFWKKFAILKEEMQVDQDSFDYIFIITEWKCTGICR